MANSSIVIFKITGNKNEGWEWDNLNIQENFYNAKYIAYNLDQNKITYKKEEFWIKAVDASVNPDAAKI